MKDLIALLKGNQAISGYRVASVARKTYELFFVHRKLETVRALYSTSPTSFPRAASSQRSLNPT